MDISLTLGETCILVLSVALFFLLIYCISFIRKLFPSIKLLEKILQNTEVITSNVAKGTDSVESVVEEVADISSAVMSSVKSRTTLIGQISSISSAVKTIVTLFSDRNADNADSDNDNKKKHEKDIPEESLESSDNADSEIQSE